MSMYMLLGPGILLVLGLIFLIIGLAFSANKKKKEKRCSAQTVGRVTDVVRRSRRSDGRVHSAWYPVFEYYAGGRMITKESSFGSAPPKYTTGQEVEIRYNPEKCEEYYVVGEKVQKILAIVFTAVGAGLLLIMAVILGIMVLYF